MAIDQPPSTSVPQSPTVSAIENEFATYRAISTGAVLSLILAFVSVFCYASLWFLVVVAGSVAAGLISLRNIRRFPDVLTGAVFARLGIGLALLFGLTSLTLVTVEEINIRIDAGRFAKLYVEIIRDKHVDEALWFEQKPDYRQKKTATELATELKNTKGGTSPDPYKDRANPIEKIKARLKGQGVSIHYAGIESKVVDGLTVYANVLLELDGEGTKDLPEKERFALVRLLKGPNAGRYDWFVEEVKFPYTPASVIATLKPTDDGHGH